MKKNLALISILFTAALAACGGGGGSSSPAPAPAPTPATGAALDLAKATLSAYDTSLATSIPATGAAASALTDACSLNNGFSKALAIADYDADTTRVSSRQFEIGSSRTGISVLADRNITNADGTSRREIDVQYAVNYTDGTKDEKTTQTLISGSSSGSTMADGVVCTTPENKTELRFFGNRKVVNTFASASNEKIISTALTTGVTNASPTYNRFVTLGVRDPANVATYATVSGPGLGTTAGVPNTFKLVSPRLLRSAPEFAGKVGNYIDWKDNDNFRVCRTSTGGYAFADTADCVLNGATSNTYGSFGLVDPSLQDANFNALGLVAGGVYTVKVYSGNGWKTINGQAGVTPIATYATTLENLPMSTVDLAGTLAAPANKFAVVNSTTTQAQVATAVRNKAAISIPFTWTRPGAMPDGRATALSALWSFENGPTTAAGFYPATRQINLTYPASTATSATLNVPVPVPALLTPNYGEAAFEYSNRNGNFIRNIFAVL
jgi:hypothetical protein